MNPACRIKPSLYPAFFLLLLIFSAISVGCEFSSQINGCESTEPENPVKSISAVTQMDTPAEIVLPLSDLGNCQENGEVTAPPNNGIVSGTVTNLLYTPEENFTGTDSFAFMVQCEVDTTFNVEIKITGPEDGGDDATDTDTPPTDSTTDTTTDNDGKEDDWLHTSGNRIVDSHGNTVWLTGANWFGFNAHERVFHGLWSAKLETMLKAIAERGINILRIPISTQLLAEWMEGRPPTPVGLNYYANPELEGMDTLEIFDLTLQLCETYGLKVMLDVHSAEANNSGHVFPMWYTESISTETFYKTWEWVADRYKNNDTLIALDIENEPHGKVNERPRAKWDDSSDPDNWKYVCEQASKRILAKNPHILVLCEGIEVYPKEGVSWTDTDEKAYYGTWWGGNLRGVADYPIDLGGDQDQLVYSPHDYGPSVWPQVWFEGDFTMQSLYEDVWYPNWFFIHENKIAPLLIGEWGGFMDGGDNEKWMVLLRDFIEENHIHHTFWCINPNSGDTGGLINHDWATWDEEKYELVEPVLWQDSNGRFVGLDHDVPLGGAQSRTGISLNQFYRNGGAPPNP